MKVNCVNFSRDKLVASKPKLGRSLSMSVLVACLTIIATVFGGSNGTATSILLIGLGLAWVNWPIHYLLRKVMKPDRFSFRSDSLVLPKMDHAKFTHHKDGSVSGHGKTKI
jgi:hypothetical protein